MITKYVFRRNIPENYWKAFLICECENPSVSKKIKNFGDICDTCKRAILSDKDSIQEYSTTDSVLGNIKKINKKVAELSMSLEDSSLKDETNETSNSEWKPEECSCLHPMLSEDMFSGKYICLKCNLPKSSN